MGRTRVVLVLKCKPANIYAFPCIYYNISKAKGFLVCLSQEFAMPQSYSEFFYSYWTGLSRNSSGKAWLWMDGTPYSSEL